MIKLSIDNREAEAKEGSTILDAARALKISIPTMCFAHSCKPFTSCMVCMVYDKASNKLLPACSSLCQEGMDITTDDEKSLQARKTALELLLSEHIGDCEAPCFRVCPAEIDIPAMLRHIASGNRDAAREAAQHNIKGPNPCGDCKAPCENACRRREHDGSVAIKDLVTYALKDSEEFKSSEKRNKRFNCNIGRLKPGEMDEFLKPANISPRITPAEQDAYTNEEATNEAMRCLHCDCRKKDACKLRDYSHQYGAKQREYSSEDRNSFYQDLKHTDAVHEPGKCIKCGLCVQLSAQAGEDLGMAFHGRGYDVSINSPFNRSLDKALKKSTKDCISICPTAALAKK